MNQQNNILVLFGGCSPEHDISIASAATVIQYLDGYNVIPVCITREGKWLLYDGKLDNIKNIGWEKYGTPAVLSPDRVNRGLLRIVGDKVKTIPVDAVFPVLHGENGEDGTVQGLCALAGIPFVGCGVLSSAVCMDKSMLKLLARSLGFPVAEYRVFKENQLKDLHAAAKTVRYQIGYPCFIKPACAGSSIGISRVNNKQELMAAFTDAMKYSNKIIAERAVTGREIECGVLGAAGDVTASVPGEVFSGKEFYDYEAKYGNAGTTTDVPANLPEETTDKIRAMAVEIFNAADCRGLARADFFVEASGRVVFNEINTMPGFTAISLFSRMWEASGVPMRELIDRLLKIAFTGTE